MKRRFHRLTLFWRVYLYGFALVVAVAITAGISTSVMRSMGQAPMLHGALEPILQMMTRHLDRHEMGDLEVLVRDLHQLSGTCVAVFDARGEELTRTGDAPSPGELSGRPRLRHRDGYHHLIRPMEAEGRHVGTVVLSWAGFSHFWRGLAVLGSILVILSLMPYLLARGISRPLESMTRAARQLASGDLSARTGIKRRDELGTLAQTFDRMADRIQGMIRAEKELLANISHEIRTPLARIRVAMEILGESLQAADVDDEDLRDLGEDVEELENLTEEVLLTARLEFADLNDAPLPLRVADIALPALLDSIARRFHRRHPHRKLMLEHQTQIAGVQGDERLVRRLFEVILENAVKYSEVDQPISLTVKGGEGFVQLEIRDRGLGLDPEEVAQLFQPFFRGKQALASGKAGIGIGLALAARIVQAHHGTIVAEPAHPGARIRIQLPLASPNAED